MCTYKRILFILGFMLTLPAWAQIEDPVDWQFSTKDLGNGEYELVFQANVDAGWHIYSQFTSDDGPVPTTFTFESKEGLELQGKTEEFGEIEKGYDDLFMTEVATFKSNATFKQKVKVTSSAGQLSGYVTFMVCNDEKCLPPTDEEFSFSLKGVDEKKVDTKPQQEDKSQDQAAIPPSTPSQPEAKEEKPQERPISSTQNEAKAETDNPFQNPISEIELENDPQIFEPVKWQFGHKKLEDGSFQLIFSASIDDGWKIYAPTTPPVGPIPLSLNFEEGEVERVGEFSSNKKPTAGYDEIFKGDVETFKGKVVFTQTIKASEEALVNGFLSYMACTNEICTPQETSFEIDLSKEGSLIDAGSQAQIAAGEDHPFRINSINRESPVASCSEANEFSTENYGNLLYLFFLGLGGGIFAFLTPCVFPMVPLTVSFFTKSSQDKRSGIFNGAAYGLSIFLIYTLVSLPFHLVPGLDSSVFNIISTDPILNTIFFVVFIVFAFSFFGFYEITLPSAFANNVNKGASAKGLLGIFLMALTLAIVSFSCTGPLFGTVFALSTKDFVSAWSVTAAAAGFGVALGLPFAIFAAFPGLLNALPKSGSWLNTTKVILGFIEIALALKFLSKADLVGKWGILPREIFIGIWIVIGILMAVYLFGLYAFPHETKPKPLPSGRVILGIGTIALIGYLIPAFWTSGGFLSGILPPMTYSLFAEENDCPHDLNCFKDYQEGLAYAKSVNKPIMIDFTGHGCENCRKMEENVWPEDKVLDYISEDYVLISLYVDEREKLEAPILIDNGKGGVKKLRTIGNKWTEFQIVNFLANSQPYYVLMSPDEVLLNNPVGYTPNVNEYESFLECGLNAFKQLADK